MSAFLIVHYLQQGRCQEGKISEEKEIGEKAL
jgi:hypothetical protein